jgi:hypothetical protein
MVTDVKRLPVLVALVGAALLVAAVSGCGGHSTTKASLVLVADGGLGSKAVFHLRCDPVGGDIAHPARACAALAKHPDALLHPKPFTCAADFWRITISGHFKGRPVNVETDTCWTPQMELIGLLGISDQLNAHIVPLPVRRDLFAKVAEIWPGTPAWVIPVARAEVRVLHDPQPLRMRITDNLVELWGDFHCQNWRLAKNRQPPHQIRRGTYARFTIDRETHKVTSLWIGPKHLGGEGALRKAEDNVRASVDAISAYRRDHGTYVGINVPELNEESHANLKVDPVDPAWLGKNRFCVESTVEGRIASENWPPLPSGKIADQPCGLER